MAYVDRPDPERPIYSNAVPQVTNNVIDYHDRVRWGPIFAGIVIAISIQLVLSAIGTAFGANSLSSSGAPRSNVGGAVTGIGIWVIISALISLFVAGYTTSRACGPMTRSSAIFNGAILWATTIVISAWILSTGLSGTFGIFGLNNGAIANQVLPPHGGVNVTPPNISAGEAKAIAANVAKANWWFALGCLLSFIATLIGSRAGLRPLRSRV